MRERERERERGRDDLSEEKRIIEHTKIIHCTSLYIYTSLQNRLHLEPSKDPLITEPQLL